MSVEWGVWFAGELGVARMVDLARLAEASGASSVWMAEGYYARDAFVPLAAIAQRTERVRVATGVVNPFTRHPAVLAMSFATLDEMSGGRVVAGIGAGARHQVEGEMGYVATRPLTAVREAVDILDAMASRQRVHYRGDVFRADGVQLVVRGPRTTVPIYLAAVGPRMCRLAGERAAGVYLPQTSPRFVRQATAWVAEGAAAAGRSSDDVDIAAMIVMAVDDDADVAERQVRALLGILLLAPESERLLEENGLDPGEAEAVRAALRSGGMRAMAERVRPEVVRTLAIAGPASYCGERLLALVDAGVTHPVVSLIGQNPEAAIAAAAAVWRGDE